MLAITAVDGVTYDVDADTWHVDDSHGLHLRTRDGKAAASFAASKWITVIQKPKPGKKV